MTQAIVELAERPVTKSIVEEVCGLLWAILATISPIPVISIIAWIMAATSTSAAIYYAFRERRATASMKEGE